jgi:hypothetical protein
VHALKTHRPLYLVPPHWNSRFPSGEPPPLSSQFILQFLDKPDHLMSMGGKTQGRRSCPQVWHAASASLRKREGGPHIRPPTISQEPPRALSTAVAGLILSLDAAFRSGAYKVKAILADVWGETAYCSRPQYFVNMSEDITPKSTPSTFLSRARADQGMQCRRTC